MKKKEIRKFKPIYDDGFTVRELLEILQNADPDALIMIGRNENDCENYLYGVNVGEYLVGFFTEAESEDQ